MSSFRIASRYSKSLLKLAQEKNVLETVYTEMMGIHALTSSSKELKLLLKSPVISADKKLAVLSKLFDGKVSEITYRFLELLVKKGREAYVPEIAASFIEQYKVLNKITTIRLTTAVKLEDATVNKLIEDLKQKTGITQVDLVQEIDETLIGGYILQYGDNQIDASVSRRLQQFRSAAVDESYTKKY
jgi:F-type H+-transporting ATPase subunit delta